MAVMLIIAGAFLWRLRGGLLNDLTGKANWHGANDTVVRFIWSVGMSGVFWLSHPLPAWRIAILALALFAGTTLIGWFGGLAADTPKHVALMSLSGALRMAFVAVALLSPWALVAGVLCGPIYWIGNKIPKPYNWLFWGEILFGAAIGAALIFA